MTNQATAGAFGSTASPQAPDEGGEDDEKERLRRFAARLDAVKARVEAELGKTVKGRPY
jgi:hypothetical protein